MTRPATVTIPITMRSLSNVKISKSWTNSDLTTKSTPTRRINATTDENKPKKAALARNGPRINAFVAPTSFMVWTVNLLAGRLRFSRTGYIYLTICISILLLQIQASVHSASRLLGHQPFRLQCHNRIRNLPSRPCPHPGTVIRFRCLYQEPCIRIQRKEIR